MVIKSIVHIWDNCIDRIQAKECASNSENAGWFAMVLLSVHQVFKVAPIQFHHNYFTTKVGEDCFKSVPGYGTPNVLYNIKAISLKLLAGSVLSFLIAKYSTRYLYSEGGLNRFFNTLLFFCFGYETLAVSGNFKQDTLTNKYSDTAAAALRSSAACRYQLIPR
ncbi:hypothetical protein GC194_11715 [bacterium]|nr:hypothetical protein [bacterium]